MTTIRADARLTEGHSVATPLRGVAGVVPTIKGIAGPYRFFFYSLDCDEPPHVHVEREHAQAKFWLESLAVMPSRVFSKRELNRIRTIIFALRMKILEAWHGHCD